MRNVQRTLVALLCLAGIGMGWFVYAEDKHDEKKEHETAQKVLAMAKTDLLKAIATAQAKVPKGKPIYAITEEEKGKQLFEVYLLVGDDVTEVEVDAVTGEIVNVEEGENDEIEDLPAVKKLVAAAKITFAEAITAAKGKVEGGKPFEVEFEEEGDKAIIKIELWAGQKVMEVEIDAVTGKVLEVEEED